MARICIFLICCFTVLTTFARNPQPAWRNYSTDDGLPSQEVHCILQDSKGYMWFGTDNGVSRFNGYNFQNFGAREGLQDNVVFELQEDHLGRIWMNTMGGNIYYYRNDSIHAYQYNHIIQQFRSRFFIAQNFYVDEEETVYTCLHELGILKIDNNGEYELFSSEFPGTKIVMEPDGVFLSSNFQLSNTEVNNSHQASHTRSVGPVEFLTKDGRIPTTGIELITRESIRPIVYKLREKQYLLVQNRSLFFIDRYRILWRHFMDHIINATMSDSDGSIYLMLDRGGGIRKYTNYEAIRKDEYKQYLAGSSVTRLYRDKRGGYWAATIEHGVFFTPGMDIMIYDEEMGFSGNFISAVEPATSRLVFFGQRDGSLYQIMTSNDELTSLLSQGRSDPIFDLWYDQQANQLWIGSGRTEYLTPGEKSSHMVFARHPNRKTFWSGAKILSPVPGKRKLWIAGFIGIGLIDVDKKEYILLSQNGYHTVRFRDRVFTALEDYESRVWLGKENGLFRWNHGDPVKVDVDHPAFHIRIEDLIQLPDSTLVIATKGQGVVLWKDDHIAQFTTSDGLTANMIEDLQVDEQGRLWVGTLNGLNRLSREKPDKWSIKQITTAHGLPSNSVNMVKTMGEEVWVATDRGLVRFDEVRENNFSPAPQISSVFVDNRMLESDTFSRLSFWEHNLTIHFTTINFSMNGRIPYRFRIGNGQWTETFNTSVNFPSLSPGEWLFEVQSQNEDGIWSRSASYTLYIASPWWKSWWAIGALWLYITLMIYGIYKYRTNSLKKEIALQKQMAALERQALRSQMNPHFIFNALNAIQGYIAMGDKMSANRYLSRFARLIRAALQYSRVTRIPLEDDLRNLENYLELEQMRFDGNFDFKIDLDPDIVSADLTIPPMLVQPFVENAIVHGMARKEGKGQIDLAYQLQNGCLVVTVTDNGIGIEKSKKEKSGIASAHQSIGMTVTARRLAMLNGNTETGHVEIEELKDGQGGVAGTQVRVRIPLEPSSS